MPGDAPADPSTRARCSSDRPTTLLLLAWNFADEIIAPAGRVPSRAAAGSSSRSRARDRLTGGARRCRVPAACPSCGADGSSSSTSSAASRCTAACCSTTREEALGFPRGDLELALLPRLRLHHQHRLRPGRCRATRSSYEETQGFSPRFRDVRRASWPQRWVERYDLRGKDVLEIGCGKGEFLLVLCELGGEPRHRHRPGLRPERARRRGRERIEFIARLLRRAATRTSTADVVVCRHTLEHIRRWRLHAARSARSIGDRATPSSCSSCRTSLRVLREVAFWDIYYEHCSYFTPGSLARLFRARLRGARPRARLRRPVHPDRGAARRARGARPSSRSRRGRRRRGRTLSAELHAETLRRWREAPRARGRARRALGRRLEGGRLPHDARREASSCVVDINPYKQGVPAGTGAQVVAPEALREYRPDLVVAMNPVYLDEIGRTFRSSAWRRGSTRSDADRLSDATVGVAASALLVDRDLERHPDREPADAFSGGGGVRVCHDRLAVDRTWSPLAATMCLAPPLGRLRGGLSAR